MCTVMNLGIPQNSGILFTACKPITFSRRTLLLGGSFVHEVGKSTCVLQKRINELLNYRFVPDVITDTAHS